MMRFLLCCVVATVTACETNLCRGQSAIQELQRHVKDAERLIEASDRDRAIEVAGKMIELCNREQSSGSGVDQTPILETQRFQFLLITVLIDRKVGNTQRALQTSIDLLARYWEPSEANEPIRIECQVQVFETIISIYTSGTSELDRLSTAIETIENRMIESRVPPGIAKLAQFARARRAEQSGRNELLEESLDGLKSVIANEQLVSDYYRAMYWNLRATLHANRRQYFDAFDACRQFERYALQTSPQRRQNLVAISRDQSALIAIKIGDYAEAKRKLESTIDIHTRGDEDPRVRLRKLTEWRINMATALAGSDEIPQAQQLLENAAIAIQGIQKAPKDLIAAVDNNLGLIHYLNGDFQQADGLIDRALENASGVAIAEASVNAGWIALGLKDIDSAAQHFEEAGKIFHEILAPEHPRNAESLTYRARVAALQDKRQDAVQWIRQAEQLDYARVCRDLGSANSVRDRIALVQEARVHPESIAWPGALDTYLELAPKLRIPAQVQYEVVLRWKGLVQRFDDLLDEIGSEAAIREKTLSEELTNAYFDRPASSLKLREWQEYIDRLADDVREIQRQRRANRKLDPTTRKIDVPRIASTLRPTDLLVDIIQIRTFRTPSSQGPVGSSQRYIAFALRPDGNVQRFSIGSADELDNAIVQWSEAIVTQGREIPTRAPLPEESTADTSRRGDERAEDGAESLQQFAARVARLVQRPILATDAEFKRLLIRPDAMTHLIPWAALPGTHGKSYWIENLPIQICNRVPIEVEPVAEAETPSLLAMGGVEFGALRGVFPNLDGSLEEKDQVVRLFRAQFANGSVVELDHNSATETALLREMPGKRFIHLATHGFYERRDESNVFGVTGAITSLRTGVIVAAPGPEDAKHDQYFTAAEIRDTDLSRATLVTLSACESGLGRARAGQGVDGMLSSFHAAGVSRVVGTLWVVDDAATVPMVRRFYHHVWAKTKPAADALRAAQLEMIRTPKTHPNAKLFAHPYAWAPFFCSAK